MKVIKNCSCWEEILKKKKFDYCKEDVEEAQAILSILSILDRKVRCYDNLEEKYKKALKNMGVASSKPVFLELGYTACDVFILAEHIKRLEEVTGEYVKTLLEEINDKLKEILPRCTPSMENKIENKKGEESVEVRN
jgi:hypothetical protein